MDSAQLDATFLALADPTRRAILARLAESEATVTEFPFRSSVAPVATVSAVTAGSVAELSKGVEDVSAGLASVQEASATVQAAVDEARGQVAAMEETVGGLESDVAALDGFQVGLRQEGFPLRLPARQQ